MLSTNLNNSGLKAAVRCVKCDREMSHYNIFTDPANANTNVCWQCTDRKEKGFNTKRDWKRSARQRILNIFTEKDASVSEA